jgi:hypothetical protein
MDLISKIKNKQKIVIILLSINLAFSLLAFSSILSLINITISVLLVYFVSKKTIKSYSYARNLLIFIFLASMFAKSKVPLPENGYETLLSLLMLGIIALSFFLIISIRESLILQSNIPSKNGSC